MPYTIKFEDQRVKENEFEIEYSYQVNIYERQTLDKDINQNSCKNLEQEFSLKSLEANNRLFF